VHSRTFNSTLYGSPLAAGCGAAGTTLLMASETRADSEMLFCVAGHAGVCAIQHAYQRKVAWEFRSRVEGFVHRCAAPLVS